MNAKQRKAAQAKAAAAAKAAAVATAEAEAAAAEADEDTDPALELPEAFQFELAEMTSKSLDALKPELETAKDALFAKIEAGDATMVESDQYVAMVERINEVSVAQSTYAQNAKATVTPDADPEDEADLADPAPKDEADPADPAPKDEADEADPADPADLADPEPTLTDEQARDAIMAGLAVLNGKTAAPVAPLQLTKPRKDRPLAPMVAGVAVQNGDTKTISLQEEILDDASFGNRVASFANRQSAGAELTIGGWQVWEESDVENYGVSTSDGASSVMASFNRSATGQQRLDPKTAAPCPPGCIRRNIDDCGNMADPLDIFNEYPCDRGSVEYFTAISLSEVDGSVTVWDEAKQATFDAAYAAYHTAVTAPEPNPGAISTAWATLKACEKHCAQVMCQSSKKAAILPLAVCLEVKNEIGWSQPESIAAYRSALARLLIRERNAQRRTMLQSFSHWYGIDGSQHGGMGAFPIVYEAIKNVLSIGSVKERIESEGYVIGIDYGMLNLLDIDNIKTCNRMDDLREAAQGLPIRILLDSAVGGTQPYAADLPPIGPPGANGNFPDYTDLHMLPGTPVGTVDTPFCIEVFNPDDYETFSVPDITLTATRGAEHAKQNRMLAFFLETFEGMIKPGCNPSFTLKFWNLCANGRRAACDVVQDCLTPAPLVADDDDLADGGGANDDTVDTSAKAAEKIPAL